MHHVFKAIVFVALRTAPCQEVSQRLFPNEPHSEYMAFVVDRALRSAQWDRLSTGSVNGCLNPFPKVVKGYVKLPGGAARPNLSFVKLPETGYEQCL